MSYDQPPDPDLMSGCRDSLSLSISRPPLPAAQLAFTLSLPGRNSALRMPFHSGLIAGWLFPRGARRVCDRSPYKQSDMAARVKQIVEESAAPPPPPATTSGHPSSEQILKSVSGHTGHVRPCLALVTRAFQGAGRRQDGRGGGGRQGALKSPLARL